MRRRVVYPSVGILLALGAPGGLLLLRAIEAGVAPSPGWVAHEIGGAALVYAYLLSSTALVFTVIGFVLGRKEDLLESLSTTDPLTGLFNRRFLQTELDRELARASRYDIPLALLLVDIDRLKLINDRLGHHAGDRALTAVATAIRQHLRIHDVAARYGGDEFAVLCPHTSGREAQALAERIRQAVQNSGASGAALSISIGIEFVEAGRIPTAERLFLGADRALYAAKDAGRNQTFLSADAPGAPAA
jgi:diguanylate cyclase (GGDEF)-like protein